MMIDKPLTVFSCNLPGRNSFRPRCVPGCVVMAGGTFSLACPWTQGCGWERPFFFFSFLFSFSPPAFFFRHLFPVRSGVRNHSWRHSSFRPTCPWMFSPWLGTHLYVFLSLSLVFSFVSLSLCCAPRCCVTAGAMVSFHSVCPWCRSPSWEHPPPVSFFHQCPEPLRE